MKIDKIEWDYDIDCAKHIMYAIITDSNGYVWEYDTSQERQLRVPEADEEIEDNGYYCYSFSEAVIALKEGGYIE